MSPTRKASNPSSASWSSKGPPPFFKNNSMGIAVWYSSTRRSLVDQICNGLGKVTGAFLVMKFRSKVTRLSASFLRSSCSYIMRPNTSTSSGSETHCIPGKCVIRRAKNDMIVRSRSISLTTRGCRTLIATAAVGTDGLDSGRMAGARAPGPFLRVRFGSK
jgi:hypothetical protein